jgi:Carboxypeptidase regulatory-like domain
MTRAGPVFLLAPLFAAAVWPSQQGWPLPPQVGPGMVRPQPVGAHPQTAKGLVAGRVVDATTNRGVPHALVRLAGPGISQTWLTDATGRYLVAGLPGGDYTIRAAKPGFFDGSYGQVRPGGDGVALTLADAQWLKDVDIKVWRGAVVDGLVVDDASEPVVGALVQAWRRQFLGGREQIVAAGSATTDDEGAYRIEGLLPGEYVISVPSGAADLAAAAPGVDADTGGEAVVTAPIGEPLIPPPPQDGQAFAYPTLYYPGTPFSSLALPVELTAGQDYTGVFFQLQPLPAARVSGVAVGPYGPAAGETLRLLLDGSDDVGLGSETAIAVTAEDGSFTFPSIPAGQYTLDARDGTTALLSARQAELGSQTSRRLPPLPPGAAALTSLAFSDAGPDNLIVNASARAPGRRPQLWGQTQIIVDGRNADDVIVTMEASSTITGHVAFDGKTPAPAPDVVAGIPILVEPAGSLSTGLSSGHPDADGRFRIEGILPGQYFVRVPSAPGGWYLESVSAGGEDVSETPLDAFALGNVSDVVVTFTDTPTQLIGTVRDAQRLSVGNATIVVFPARGSLSDYGLNPRRIRAVRPTSAGVFRIEGLPPGDYDIAAIDAAWTGDWRDPRMLEALRSTATRLTLAAGQRLTQDLQVVPGPRR